MGMSGNVQGVDPHWLPGLGRLAGWLKGPGKVDGWKCCKGECWEGTTMEEIGLLYNIHDDNPEENHGEGGRSFLAAMELFCLIAGAMSA